MVSLYHDGSSRRRQAPPAAQHPAAAAAAVHAASGHRPEVGTLSRSRDHQNPASIAPGNAGMPDVICAERSVSGNCSTLPPGAGGGASSTCRVCGGAGRIDVADRSSQYVTTSRHQQPASVPVHSQPAAALDADDRPDQQRGAAGGQPGMRRFPGGIEPLPDLVSVHQPPPPPPYAAAAAGYRHHVANVNASLSAELSPTHHTCRVRRSKLCCGSRDCCSRYVLAMSTVRWTMVALASLGAGCIIIGIVLGILQMSGGMLQNNGYVTHSIMFMGLGAVLVAVIGVVWRCVLPPSDGRVTEPCRLLLELSERVARPAGPRTNQQQQQQQQQQHWRSRCRNATDYEYAYWCGGTLYPEFHNRCPPPSYSAAMLQERQPIAECRAANINSLGGRGLCAVPPSSPPPGYGGRQPSGPPTAARPRLCVAAVPGSRPRRSTPSRYQLQHVGQSAAATRGAAGAACRPPPDDYYAVNVAPAAVAVDCCRAMNQPLAQHHPPVAAAEDYERFGTYRCPADRTPGAGGGTGSGSLQHQQPCRNNYYCSGTNANGGSSHRL